MANSIITLKAKEKIVKARANIAPIAPIAGFCFGTGGAVGSDVIPPSFSASSLNHEVLRKPFDTVVQTSSTSFKYKVTLTAANIPNVGINEIGLYDTDGDLIVIKTFQTKPKDPDIDMGFEIDDTF